jgi:DNA-binding MarR family transcriptional regulator
MRNISKDKVINDLYLVLRAVYHHERELTNRFGLRYEEIYTMQFIRLHPGASLSELSKEVGQPMFKASRLVTRLIDKGLLRKDQDEVDKRSIHIKLESGGEKLLREIDEFCYQKIDHSALNKTDRHYSEMVDLVERLHQYFGDSKTKN